MSCHSPQLSGLYNTHIDTRRSEGWGVSHVNLHFGESLSFTVIYIYNEQINE